MTGVPQAEDGAIHRAKGSPRVVLVTGIAGEMGRAIADAFASAGDTVIGLDLAPIDDGPYTCVACDLADPAAITAALAEIERRAGTVDVLVNNAAYCGHAGFFDLQPAEIARTMAVNVTAVLLLCQGFVAQLRQARAGGAIVNIASIAGRRGSSQIEYGASKAGVINLTMTLARLVAADGIRVNAVAPALVDAGMGGRLSDSVRDAFLLATPLRRAAHPSEIADVVLFLASDKASYVTGQTIDISGGL